MIITLLRTIVTSRETVGQLLLGDKHLCYTIEPPLVPNAVHPKGAIPFGWYKLSVTFSPHFKRELPLLAMVPGFVGIRLHAGNNHRHTAGCVLVGEQLTEPMSAETGEYRLLNARKAETEITELIKTKMRNEEVYLYVTNAERRNAELHALTKGVDYFARF